VPLPRPPRSLLRILGVAVLCAALFGSTQATARPVGPTDALESATRAVRHPPVVVIVMENHSYGGIMGSSSAGYFRAFAKRGRLFTRYYATNHPSLPNYLQMTSGTTSGCKSDTCPQKRYRTDNLFHQLSHKRISWRAWMESMGSKCRSSSSGTYAAKHNPPLFYRNLFPTLCPKYDTPLPRRLPSKLPKFMFVTPNLCHDMHDCSITTGNRWLKAHARRFLRRGAVVIVVFDEGTDSAGGGGHVYAAEAGRGVPQGVRDGHKYSHRSLLAGLERYFGVPLLHGAKTARKLPI
jgi:hypothetical protein